MISTYVKSSIGSLDVPQLVTSQVPSLLSYPKSYFFDSLNISSASLKLPRLTREVARC